MQSVLVVVLNWARYVIESGIRQTTTTEYQGLFHRLILELAQPDVHTCGSLLTRRYIVGLVERHSAYGVELVHYDIVLDVLLAHLAKWEHQGERLAPEVCAAWGKVFGAIKEMAKDAYDRRDAATAAGAAAGATATPRTSESQ